MELQVIRSSNTITRIQPVRNNLLLKYTFEAKGMVIINEGSLKNLTPTNKMVVGFGETASPDYQIGTSVITKFDCFSLQPMQLAGNEYSVRSTLDRLKKFKPVSTTPSKLVLTKSDKADDEIDLNKVYTMYDYYLINEGDILAIDNMVELT